MKLFPGTERDAQWNMRQRRFPRFQSCRALMSGIAAFTDKASTSGSSSGAVPGCGEENFSDDAPEWCFWGNDGPRGSGMASKSNSMGASYVLTWRPPVSMISRSMAASNVLFAAAHDACYKHKAIGGHCMVKYFPFNSKVGQCRRN